MSEKQGTRSAAYANTQIHGFADLPDLRRFIRREGENIMTTAKTFSTRYMVELALMIAIVFLMSFTPLGYIRTPGLSVTLLTVPVAVGAVILGPTGGAICGLAFGLTSFYQCFSSAFGTMLLAINPIGAFCTSVIPRILEGWLTGLFFAFLYSRVNTRRISYYAASLACPLLNTLLFMSSLVLFFYSSDYIQGIAAGLGVGNPFTFVLAFVGLQGLIEAILCFLIASVVSRTLHGVLGRER